MSCHLSKMLCYSCCHFVEPLDLYCSFLGVFSSLDIIIQWLTNAQCVLFLYRSSLALFASCCVFQAASSAFCLAIMVDKSLATSTFQPKLAKWQRPRGAETIQRPRTNVQNNCTNALTCINQIVLESGGTCLLVLGVPWRRQPFPIQEKGRLDSTSNACHHPTWEMRTKSKLQKWCAQLWASVDVPC